MMKFWWTVLLTVGLIGVYVTGKWFSHEVVGLIFSATLVVHIVQWRKWWASIFKGMYTKRRYLTMLLNVALLIGMLIVIVTGIVSSRSIFHFQGIVGSIRPYERVHIILGDIMMVLGFIHLLIHLPYLRQLRNRLIENK